MKSLTSEKINYRFPIWLTVIFLFLFSVPIFVLLNLILLAKIFGFFSLIIVIIAIRVWLRITRSNSNKKNRVVLNRNIIFDLERKYPFLLILNSSEKITLFHRTGLILAEARFISGNQFLDFSIATDIAFNIAILISDLPYKNLNGLLVQLGDKPSSQYEVLYLGNSLDFSFFNKRNGFSVYRNSLLESNFGQKTKEVLNHHFQYLIV